MQNCSHVSEIGDVEPSADGCVKIGDAWVHLRLCMTCGHIGCCDDSKNKHGTTHFRKIRHPIVQSFQSGEDWLWCYADEVFLEPAAAS